jgi:hypothetical protein
MHLHELEAKTIYIIREVTTEFKNSVRLHFIGRTPR